MTIPSGVDLGRVTPFALETLRRNEDGASRLVGYRAEKVHLSAPKGAVAMATGGPSRLH